MMEHHESLELADTTVRAPHVALTETQLADYEHLMSLAESLRGEGEADEAARVARIAARIVRSGAPCLE